MAGEVLKDVSYFLTHGRSSFTSLPTGGDSDLRQVYCAFAISSILDDWSGIDVDLAVRFIQRCSVSPVISLLNHCSGCPHRVMKAGTDSRQEVKLLVRFMSYLLCRRPWFTFIHCVYRRNNLLRLSFPLPCPVLLIVFCVTTHITSSTISHHPVAGTKPNPSWRIQWTHQQGCRCVLLLLVRCISPRKYRHDD